MQPASRRAARPRPASPPGRRRDRPGTPGRSTRRSSRADARQRRRAASPVARGNRSSTDHAVAVVEDGGLTGGQCPLRFIEVDPGLLAQRRYQGFREGGVRADLDARSKRRGWNVAGDVANILEPTARAEQLLWTTDRDRVARGVDGADVLRRGRRPGWPQVQARTLPNRIHGNPIVFADDGTALIDDGAGLDALAEAVLQQAPVAAIGDEADLL